MVPCTAPASVPLRKMSYAMTATLSVEAVQVRLTLVPLAVPLRLVGVLGGVGSGQAGGGMLIVGLLPCGTLPAASRACTYRPHCTFCTTAKLVDSVLPSTDLMSWPSWNTS